MKFLVKEIPIQKGQIVIGRPFKLTVFLKSFALLPSKSNSSWKSIKKRQEPESDSINSVPQASIHPEKKPSKRSLLALGQLSFFSTESVT